MDYGLWFNASEIWNHMKNPQMHINPSWCGNVQSPSYCTKFETLIRNPSKKPSRGTIKNVKLARCMILWTFWHDGSMVDFGGFCLFWEYLTNLFWFLTSQPRFKLGLLGLGQINLFLWWSRQTRWVGLGESQWYTLTMLLGITREWYHSFQMYYKLMTPLGITKKWKRFSYVCNIRWACSMGCLKFKRYKGWFIFNFLDSLRSLLGLPYFPLHYWCAVFSGIKLNLS